MSPKLITVTEALVTLEKKYEEILKRAYSALPTNPNKIKRHNEVVEVAKEYLKELSQVLDILKLCDGNCMAVVATEAQYKKILDGVDDSGTEIAGKYCYLASIWQFPLESPYVLIYTKALNKAFK